MKRLLCLASLMTVSCVSTAQAQVGYDALNGEPVPYLQPQFASPGSYGYGNGYAPSAVATVSPFSVDPSVAANAAREKLDGSAEAAKQFKAAIEATEATVAASAKGSVDGVIAALNNANADPAMANGVELDSNLTHQPLIHIKARVIEVQRTDSLAVSSILDFITDNKGAAPFGATPFSAQSLNRANQRFSGITRLPVAGLTDVAGNGSGMLVNLTTDNINYLVSMLATEVNADTVTAPQVTTINGNAVEFRAGSFVPFALGKNSIVNNVNTTQEFFYRHVGAYIKVTPQIVNWDAMHNGLGKIRSDYATTPADRRLVDPAEVSDEEISNAIVALLQTQRYPNDDNSPRLGDYLDPGTHAALTRYSLKPALGADNIADARTTLVNAYNSLIASGISRFELSKDVNSFSALDAPIVDDSESCSHCNWRPSDCTINLNLSVRVSDPNLTQVAPTAGSPIVPVFSTSEQNVRAISNVVQLKSGRGCVLGGLITMRDIDTKQKVPFLGDIPYLGAAFRSVETARIKTETLIFLEAEVLPGFDDCYDECGRPLVESMTARDFQNGRVHTLGDVTDSPLNVGMQRAGLAGEYLPHPTHGEKDYWRCYKEQQHERRVRRLSNHAIDVLK